MLDTLREFIRPVSVASFVFVLLSGAVAAGVMEAVSPGLGIKFTNGVAGWFKAIPEAFYNLTMVTLLGYTGARTIQKGVTTYATAKYDKPTRNEVGGIGEEPPE